MSDANKAKQKAASGPVHRVTRQRAHQIDPIEDGDLDGIYSALLRPVTDGSPLYWGLMVSVMRPGWTPGDEIFGAGPDWQAILKTDGHKIPVIERSKRGPRTTGKRSGRPTAWLLVETGKSTLNEARDAGRQAVQSLLGLIQLRLPSLQMPEILWEGAFNPRNKRAMVTGFEVKAPGLSAAQLKKDLGLMSKLRIGGLPNHIALGLRWYAKAWTDRNRVDRFIHFWLATVVLVDHGYSRSQRNKVSQRKRIEKYIAGFPALSATRRSEMARDLKDSYTIRNEVQHEANTTNVTDASLARLESRTTEALRVELNRL